MNQTTQTARNKSEKYILDTLASHGEVHAMQSMDFGNRILNAARRLADEGLVQIVDWHRYERNWTASYRIIPAKVLP